jgi:hypothetical protein
MFRNIVNNLVERDFAEVSETDAASAHWKRLRRSNEARACHSLVACRRRATVRICMGPLK